ncbi:hypothetical protein EVAR_12907_1 [Eumeta japonica]|uniref:Uncharacterized protein n=1 Tax=Eumeta variegata TaxID=151549 RepID=A0A4C1TWU3_EUMVA|nr:hypothetical protein EVAR_12907_1 [Eumeta japonica]
MRGRQRRRSLRYDRESVHRTHVALIPQICEVHGHAPSIVICTPIATCEARAAIYKSEHRNAVHHFAHTPQECVLRSDHEENSKKRGLTRRF